MKKSFFGFVLFLTGLVWAGWKVVVSVPTKSEVSTELSKLSTVKEITVAGKDSICN